jgi:hypothetical protein
LELVIEVKTTDYVTISLDKLADYRDRLAADKQVQGNASMLVIVGREDTGALEARYEVQDTHGKCGSSALRDS